MRPISQRRLEANHTEPLELPKGPSHPCCNSRSSPTYLSPLERKHERPAHIQRSPVSVSKPERRDPFPALSGKNSRRSHSVSRGAALHRKGERNSRVVPPFPESPTCLSPFHGNLFSLHCLGSQAEDRLTQRWHVGQPFGKASWESLVGKTRGKATDPLLHKKGSEILQLQLGR